ncbi:hypothetical protein [Pseudomonas sp. LB3P31]
MTTIIVKGANFASGHIAHYSPPVEGASLCAFVGDSDDTTWLRNFGSGADLTVAKGAPEKIDAAFRRFGPQNYLASGVYRTPEITVMAVYRSIVPATLHGVLLSSEREAVVDPGRRGISLLRANGVEAASMTVFGTNTSNVYQTFTNQTAVSPTGPAFIAGTVEPLIPTGARTSIARLTPAPLTGTNATSTTASLAPTVDEASFPLRIGTHYRADQSAIGLIDIGFLAVFPRVLTATEKDAMYQSVKKRFAALGVAI